MAWSQIDCQLLLGAYTDSSDNGKPSMCCKRIPGMAVYLLINLDVAYDVEKAGKVKVCRRRGIRFPWRSLRVLYTSRSVLYSPCISWCRYASFFCRIPFFVLTHRIFLKGGDKVCCTAVLDKSVIPRLKLHRPGLSLCFLSELWCKAPIKKLQYCGFSQSFFLKQPDNLTHERVNGSKTWVIKAAIDSLCGSNRTVIVFPAT